MQPKLERCYYTMSDGEGRSKGFCMESVKMSSSILGLFELALHSVLRSNTAQYSNSGEEQYCYDLCECIVH